MLDVPLSVHLHNDFGLALSNALASIENGASAVATTINGMGERAGNVPTETLAIALEMMYGVHTGIDVSQLARVCDRVSEISRVPLSGNHPWVGSNVFRHESGIHVAAIHSNPLTYECVSPETVGRKREIVLGKHTGRSSMRHKLEELGLNVAEPQLDNLLDRIKAFAEEGGSIDDATLREMVIRAGGDRE
jgi:isopropylmalate/homocitrate/citramalate synthase